MTGYSEELEFMTLLDTFGVLLINYINIFTSEDIKIVKGICRNGILLSLYSYIFIIIKYLRSRIGALLIAISISLFSKKLLVVKVAYLR